MDTNDYIRNIKRALATAAVIIAVCSGVVVGFLVWVLT